MKTMTRWMKRTKDGVCFQLDPDTIKGGGFTEVSQEEAEVTSKRGRVPPPDPPSAITLPPMGAMAPPEERIHLDILNPSEFTEPVIDLENIKEPAYVEPPEAMPAGEKGFADMSKAELVAFAKSTYGVQFTAAETKVNMVKVLEKLSTDLKQGG